MKKEYLTLLQPKEILEEAAHERVDEIENLRKQIDFNNLVYYFKGESGWKTFINFKSLLNFYKNIKDGYATLEKVQKIKNI